MTSTPHKIGFISLGCPKATVDAEKILTLLRRSGYIFTNNYSEAALIIINTCGFIEPAIKESLDAIGEAMLANGRVIVTGCLGAKPDIVRQKYPGVLHITGPNAADEIVKVVKKVLPLPKDNLAANTKNLESLTDSYIKLTPAHYAYLKISEGCNNHCSFCIIPDLRGRQKSRPPKEIIAEAKRLQANGVKEIILVAQDTLSYGSDLGKKGIDIFKLIAELSKLKILIRLHYLYPYPKLDRLLPLMAKNKILPYLDVPLQHINSRILQLMRRPALRENILRRIASWRNMCPGIAIRSTFIVGFPGETEKEFVELLDFLKEAQLDYVGCFKYSTAPQAKANLLPHQIDELIKDQRRHRLMMLQKRISAAKLKKMVGKPCFAFVEKITKNSLGARQLTAAPDIDGKVFVKLDPQSSFKGRIKVGDVVKVHISRAGSYDLYGEILAIKY